MINFIILSCKVDIMSSFVASTWNPFPELVQRIPRVFVPGAAQIRLARVVAQRLFAQSWPLQPAQLSYDWPSRFPLYRCTALTVVTLNDADKLRNGKITLIVIKRVKRLFVNTDVPVAAFMLRQRYLRAIFAGSKDNGSHASVKTSFTLDISSRELDRLIRPVYQLHRFLREVISSRP